MTIHIAQAASNEDEGADCKAVAGDIPAQLPWIRGAEVGSDDMERIDSLAEPSLGQQWVGGDGGDESNFMKKGEREFLHDF